MTQEQIEEKLNSIGQELALSERSAIQKSSDFETRIKALEGRPLLDKRIGTVEERLVELTNVINSYVAVIKTIQTSIQQLSAGISKVAVTPQVPPAPPEKKAWWNF